MSVRNSLFLLGLSITIGFILQVRAIGADTETIRCDLKGVRYGTDACALHLVFGSEKRVEGPIAVAIARPGKPTQRNLQAGVDRIRGAITACHGGTLESARNCALAWCTNVIMTRGENKIRAKSGDKQSECVIAIESEKPWVGFAWCDSGEGPTTEAISNLTNLVISTPAWRSTRAYGAYESDSRNGANDGAHSTALEVLREIFTADTGKRESCRVGTIETVDD